MGNKLYVGNLPYALRDAELRQIFSAFGTVVSAKVMLERDTGRSKGFAFVEMQSDAQAQAAIAALHSQPLGGRSLVVNIARPIEPRPAQFAPPGNSSARPARGNYAGRKDNGFRSPYSTGPRNRGQQYEGQATRATASASAAVRRAPDL